MLEKLFESLINAVKSNDFKKFIEIFDSISKQFPGISASSFQYPIDLFTYLRESHLNNVIPPDKANTSTNTPNQDLYTSWAKLTLPFIDLTDENLKDLASGEEVWKELQKLHPNENINRDSLMTPPFDPYSTHYKIGAQTLTKALFEKAQITPVPIIKKKITSYFNDYLKSQPFLNWNSVWFDYLIQYILTQISKADYLKYQYQFNSSYHIINLIDAFMEHIKQIAHKKQARFSMIFKSGKIELTFLEFLQQFSFEEITKVTSSKLPLKYLQLFSEINLIQNELISQKIFSLLSRNFAEHTADPLSEMEFRMPIIRKIIKTKNLELLKYILEDKDTFKGFLSTINYLEFITYEAYSMIKAFPEELLKIIDVYCQKHEESARFEVKQYTDLKNSRLNSAELKSLIVFGSARRLNHPFHNFKRFKTIKNNVTTQISSRNINALMKKNNQRLFHEFKKPNVGFPSHLNFFNGSEIEVMTTLLEADFVAIHLVKNIECFESILKNQALHSSYSLKKGNKPVASNTLYNDSDSDIFFMVGPKNFVATPPFLTRCPGFEIDLKKVSRVSPEILETAIITMHWYAVHIQRKEPMVDLMGTKLLTTFTRGEHQTQIFQYPNGTEYEEATHFTHSIYGGRRIIFNMIELFIILARKIGYRFYETMISHKHDINLLGELYRLIMHSNHYEVRFQNVVPLSAEYTNVINVSQPYKITRKTAEKLLEDPEYFKSYDKTKLDLNQNFLIQFKDVEVLSSLSSWAIFKNSQHVIEYLINQFADHKTSFPTFAVTLTENVELFKRLYRQGIPLSTIIDAKMFPYVTHYCIDFALKNKLFDLLPHMIRCASFSELEMFFQKYQTEFDKPPEILKIFCDHLYSTKINFDGFIHYLITNYQFKLCEFVIKQNQKKVRDPLAFIFKQMQECFKSKEDVIYANLKFLTHVYKYYPKSLKLFEMLISTKLKNLDVMPYIASLLRNHHYLDDEAAHIYRTTFLLSLNPDPHVAKQRGVAFIFSVINDEWHVYLGQRKEREKRTWLAPGGVIEEGEGFSGILREVEEETGISLKDFEYPDNAWRTSPSIFPHTLTGMHKSFGCTLNIIPLHQYCQPDTYDPSAQNTMRQIVFYAFQFYGDIHVKMSRNQQVSDFENGRFVRVNDIHQCGNKYYVIGAQEGKMEVEYSNAILILDHFDLLAKKSDVPTLVNDAIKSEIKERQSKFKLGFFKQEEEEEIDADEYAENLRRLIAQAQGSD